MQTNRTCRSLLLVAALLALTAASTQAQPATHPKLWYRQPADARVKDDVNGWKNNPEWLKALPVGNGFTGAMVFGDVNLERIQLNDKSLWSGSPADNDNPEAAAHLQEIRRLLYAGKYKEATALTNRTQVCKGAGSGGGNSASLPYGSFQTLGDLHLDFGSTAAFRQYYRELDLVTGIVSIRYQQNGIRFSREVFASYPDRALVIHLSASKARSLSFRLSLDRPERFTTTAAGNQLVMKGALANGKGGDGLQYQARVVTQLTGGSLRTEGSQLVITGATEVTLLVTTATNYRLHYPDYLDTNYQATLDRITRNAATRPYTSLRKRHVADFSAFLNRSSLQLGNIPDTLPTDELLRRNARTRNEPSLYALYYQYGRYLLLSSSRKGSLPANLQGMWANSLQTPWNGDYHTDINVQMNYWPAEVTNLPECHEQLIDLIQSISAPGAKTAQVQYGMKGWCVHPITNIWGFTAPGEEASWGLHTGAAAWLAEHVWEHYAFGRDTAYLQRVWPLLKNTCLFYLDWLVKDPATGQLVSGPASSPENTFFAPDGSRAQVSMGPSHDQEVINNLFEQTLLAAEVLQPTDDAILVQRIREAKAQLALPGITADGRLMEWAQDFKETEPTHRHTSHLFALFPASQVSFYRTPDMAAAAKQSLLVRGDITNGWAIAWRIAFWARLHDGDHSLQLLNNLLRPIDRPDAGNDDTGGSFANLFDACPPFQIDGNFGAPAGIAEMLLQSQENFVELLPALPSSWKTGKVTGLCARGGFVLNLQWTNHRLTHATLYSKKGGNCQLRYKNKTVTLHTRPGQSQAVPL